MFKPAPKRHVLSNANPALNLAIHSVSQNGNSFKIAFWNACGVANKMDEVEEHLKREEIKVMMIIETRTRAISVDGYQTYTAHNPLSLRSGGVAILVRDDIRHSALQTISKPFLQSAPVIVFPENTNKKGLIIAPMYCPPVFKWSAAHFTGLVDYFSKICGDEGSSSFLLCGDWNAKHSWWGNIRNCMRGRALMEAVHASNGCNILATGSATHFPYDKRKRPSAIDFCIYKGFKDTSLNINSSTDLDSDHLPLTVELMIGNSLREIDTHVASKRLMPENVNTGHFQQSLNRLIHLNTEIRSAEDIDVAVDIFLRNIYEAAAAATSNGQMHQGTGKRYTSNQRLHLQLDEATKTLLTQKKQSREIMLATRTAEARRQYRAIQNRLQKALSKLKKKRINKLFEGIDRHDRYQMQKLWKLTSKIKRQPQPDWPLRIPVSSPNLIPHGSTTDSTWTRTPMEKAEAFVTHLEERFAPKLANTSEERAEIVVKRELLKQQKQQREDPSSFRPITLPELEKTIDALELVKSPGEDKIENKIIKKLPKKALLYLILIFNSILRLGHFPKQWKHASIKMILKPGKNTADMCSYRPISLLPGFSKIFEKLLMARLFDFDDFAKAIPNYQFGFRREHGTEQQLARVTQFILKAYENKQYCSAIFLDISEAFDRVWHDGLLYKLIKLLPLNLYRILESYLNERTFCVKCSNGNQSRTGKILAGVPQGSVLGPVLYTIFASDMPLPHLITDNPAQCSTTQKTMLLSSYADDTVVMSASAMINTAVSHNQNYLDHFSNWAKKWCININANKTAHVVFTLRRIRETDISQSPSVNGQTIALLKSHTYLGIKLDQKLTLNSHVTLLCVKLKARAAKLEWLIGPNSRLENGCKVVIIKQLVMPIWQYGLPVWGALTSDSQLLHIQGLQNKIIRKTLKATRYTRNDTLRAAHNIDTVDEVFQRASERFASSLACHINPEARQLVLHPYEPQRINRARYLKQLTQYIRPLQPQNHLHQQQQQQQQIPTLLRLEEEDLEIERKKKLVEYNERQMKIIKQRKSENPTPQRYNEAIINCLRRRYNRGEIARERVVALIFGQPPAIQRIILPDYEGDPELQLSPTEQTQTQTSIAKAEIPSEAQQTSLQQSQHQEILLDRGLELVRQRLERAIDDDNGGDNDDAGLVDNGNVNEAAAPSGHFSAHGRRLLGCRNLVVASPMLLCWSMMAYLVRTNMLIKFPKFSILQSHINAKTYLRRTQRYMRHRASIPSSSVMRLQWQHHGIRPPERHELQASSNLAARPASKNCKLKSACNSHTAHRIPSRRGLSVCCICPQSSLNVRIQVRSHPACIRAPTQPAATPRGIAYGKSAMPTQTCKIYTNMTRDEMCDVHMTLPLMPLSMFFSAAIE